MRNDAAIMRARNALVVFIILLQGCEAPAPAPAMTTDSAVRREAPPVAPREPFQPPAPEMNAPQRAASAVASLPPLSDPRTRQEILLHAALYRAAWEGNVGDFTNHFLLEPAIVEAPIAMTIDDGEFRVRILAELVDLSEPVAWSSEATATGVEQQFFSGTTELATRLQVWIHQRNEAQATVIAEVGDATPHIGSSRQGVTATWDGKAWQIERDRVRLVW